MPVQMRLVTLHFELQVTVHNTQYTTNNINTAKRGMKRAVVIPHCTRRVPGAAAPSANRCATI